MEGKKEWTFLKQFIVSFVLFILMVTLSLCIQVLFNHQGASVAIIGGADGPTAIYTSQNKMPPKSNDLSQIIAILAIVVSMFSLMSYVPIKFLLRTKKDK